MVPQGFNEPAKGEEGPDNIPMTCRQQVSGQKLLTGNQAQFLTGFSYGNLIYFWPDDLKYLPER